MRRSIPYRRSKPHCPGAPCRAPGASDGGGRTSCRRTAGPNAKAPNGGVSRPRNGVKRDERTTAEANAEQTSNTARGAPGNRHLAVTMPVHPTQHHAQGCGAVVAPAFRAPSFFEGGEWK